MSFNNLNKSLERLNFQSSSPLANGINLVITNLYNKLNDSDNDYYKTEGKKNIFNNVNIHKDKNVLQACKMLDEVIKKFTSLDSTVNIYAIPINAFVTFDKFSEKILDTLEQDALRIQGRSHYEKYNTPTKLASDIMNNINLEKGNFTDPQYAKYFKNNIYISAYFFIQPSLKNPSENLFTPEEITAVILHEIGHVMTYAENLGNNFKYSELAKTSIKDMFNNKTMTSEDKMKLMRDSIDFTKLELEKYKKDKSYKTNKQMIDSFDKIFSKLEKVERPNSLIASMVIALFSPVFAIFITFLIGRWLMRRFFKNVMVYFNAKQLKPLEDKLSDTLGGLERVKEDERWADEFVVMHGYGIHIQTSLFKMDIVGRFNYSFASELVAMSIIMMGRTESDLSNMEYPGALPYDDNDRRFDFIISNSYAALKQKDLPKEVRDNWVAQIKQLRENQKVVKAIYDKKSEKWIRNFTKGIGNLFNDRMSFTPSGIQKKNLIKDYTKLLDLTREFNQNTLYYHASRLQQLLDE